MRFISVSVGRRSVRNRLHCSLGPNNHHFVQHIITQGSVYQRNIGESYTQIDSNHYISIRRFALLKFSCLDRHPPTGFISHHHQRRYNSGDEDPIRVEHRGKVETNSQYSQSSDALPRRGKSRKLPNIRKIPLSTLTQDQWEQAYASMMIHLHLLDHDGQTSNEFDPSKISGREANDCHVSVMRLIREYQAHGTVARKQRENLCVFVNYTFQAWIHLALTSPSELSVHRAVELWNAGLAPLVEPTTSTLLSTYRRIRSVQFPKPSAPSNDVDVSFSLRQLIDTCLYRESDTLSQTACKLLLQIHKYVEPKREESVDDFVERTQSQFQSCYFQLRHFGHVELALNLLEYLQTLEALPQWESIVRGVHLEEELKNPDDSDSEDDSLLREGKTFGTLSKFEAEKMSLRIINTMTEDRNLPEEGRGPKLQRMKELLENWASNKPKDFPDKELQKAAIHYFCDMNDPNEASSMYFKLSNVFDETDLREILENLIYAWARNDANVAPFRAQELTARLEELGTKTQVDINDDVYRTLSNTWLRDRSSNIRKARESLLKVKEMTLQDYIKLGDLVKDTRSLPVGLVETMCQTFEESQNQLSDEEIHLFLEKCGPLFAAARAGRECERFVRYLIENNTIPSEKLCVSFAKACDDDPDILEPIVSTLDKGGVRLGLDFFSAVMHIYLDNLVGPTALKSQRKRILHVREHMVRILNQRKAGELKCNDSEIHQLVEETLNKVSFNKRENDALQMLELVEGYFLNDDGTQCLLPLSCYYSVARVLVYKRRHSKVEALFNHLQQFYEAGSNQLRPTSDLYELLFVALERTSDSKSLSKREALLSQLESAYRETKRKEFLPKNGMYNSLVKYYSDHPTPDNAEKAFQVTKRMKELNVEPLDHAFTIATASHAIIKSKEEPVFDRVLQLANLYPELREENVHVLRFLIHACAKANDLSRKQALNEAIKSLKRLRDLEATDRHVYHHVMTTISNSLEQPSEATKLAALVFQFCCEDGFLTHTVRDQARNLIQDEKVFDQLYTAHLLPNGEEPSEWSANLQGKKSKGSVEE